eukprot:359416-Chlamydomonas_euryale.AAC.13
MPHTATAQEHMRVHGDMPLVVPLSWGILGGGMVEVPCCAAAVSCILNVLFVCLRDSASTPRPQTPQHDPQSHSLVHSQASTR